jgi:ubiquinone/menaquinone biosynthesis C-methylase UbiE
VRAGALEEQNYPDDSFDLILMSHVIEHLHDPLRTLRESRRTLRRGGTLVVTTPKCRQLGPPAVR